MLRDRAAWRIEEGALLPGRDLGCVISSGKAQVLRALCLSHHLTVIPTSHEVDGSGAREGN